MSDSIDEQTATKTKPKRFVDKVDMNSQEKLPSRNELPTDLAIVVKDLRNQIKHLVEKQGKEVTPEFKALMEGYVAKANESEKLQVKHDHVNSYNDELKQEIKQLREENKALISDMDASREALKESESELHDTKKRLDKFQIEHKETVDALTDEKERLKEKVREGQDQREKITRELSEKIEALEEEKGSISDKLLSHDHSSKKTEQDMQAQIDKLSRALREAEGLIKELKEQVELRLREIEYKDALLNQIVRQAANDNQMLNTQMSQGNPEPGGNISQIAMQMEQANQQQAPAEQNFGQTLKEGNQKDPNKSLWGAFRK